MRVRRYLLFPVAGAILLAAAALIAVLWLQSGSAKAQIARRIEQYARDQYGVRVQIGSLDYTLSPLAVRVRELIVYGEKSRFLEVSSLELDLPYSTLWSNQTRITRILIEDPRVFLSEMPRIKDSDSKKSERTVTIDDLRVSGGSLEQDDLSLKKLEMQAEMRADAINVKSLSAEAWGARLSVTGAVRNLEKPVYDFSFSAEGNAAGFSGFLRPHVANLGGSCVASGTARGEQSQYTVEGKVSCADLSLDGSAPFALDAELTANSADVSAPYNLQLHWNGLPTSVLRKYTDAVALLPADSNGSAAFAGATDLWSGQGSFHVDMGQVAGLDGRLADGRIHIDRGRLQIGGANASVSGWLAASDLRLHLHASVPDTGDLARIDPRLASIPASLQVTAEAGGPYESIQVSGEISAKAEAVSLNATGRYDVNSGRVRLRFEGSSNLGKLDPRLAGSLSASGSLAGTADRPELTADLVGEGVRAQELEVGHVQGRLRGTLSSLELNADIPRFSSSIHGTYSMRSGNVRASASFQDLTTESLRELLPESLRSVSAVASGNVEAVGNIARWRAATLNLTLSAAHVDHNGHYLDVEPGARLTVEKERISADLKVKSDQGTASLQGSFPLDRQGPVDLRASVLTRLDALALVTDQVSGQGDLGLDLTVRGTASSPVLQGTATATGCAVRWPAHSLQVTDGSLNLRLEGDRVLLNAGAQLMSADPQLPGRGSVSVDADLRARTLKPEDWSGEISIRPSDFSVADTPLILDRPVTLTIAGREVSMADTPVTIGDLLHVTVGGRLDTAGRTFEATASGETDLGIISRFNPDMEASGKLSGSFHAQGSPAGVSYSGRLRMDNGFLRYSGYPFLLEQVNLEAPVQEDRIRIEKLQARLGGGRITGGGEIGLGKANMGSLALWLKAQEVSADYPEGFRSLLDADLRLQGKDLYTLSGKILVRRSGYRENIQPQMRLVNTLLAQKRLLVPEQSFADRVKLQLDVRTLEDIVVSNNLAAIRADAQLQLTGSLYQPKLSGRMQVRPGSEIYFEGRTYLVERGNLDFVGRSPLEPRFDIRLTTPVTVPIPEEHGRTENCTVALEMNGTMEDVDMQAQSDCQALPDDRIAISSFLLTGEVQVGRASAQFLEKQLASYLTGRLLSGLQQRIAGTFGLETFEIQPLLVASETDPGARFTIGKRLAPSLNFVYSLSLSSSTSQTWIADYRLGRSFSMRLVSEEDQFRTNVRQSLRFGASSHSAVAVTSISSQRPRIASVSLHDDTGLVSESRLWLKAGDRFDYGKIRRKIEKLKEDLQKRGYLFPQMEMEEQVEAPSSVALRFEVSGRGSRRMEFTGMVVGDKEVERYREWWREGFSESSVLMEIRDDLLKDLYRRGFYQARVDQTSGDVNGVVVYRFNIVPGLRFERCKIVFAGARRVSGTDLDASLRRFFTSEAEYRAEAVRDFPHLKKKIAALYVQEGFLEPVIRSGKVAYDSERSTVTREVVIHEGPQSRVADVRISGVEALPGQLQSRLKLRKDGVYLPLALPDDQLAVQSFYEREGFVEAAVIAQVSKEAGSPDVVVSYQLNKGSPGLIRSIEISGNNRTRRSVIERCLRLKVGDLFTEQKLAEAQGRLYQLGIFERVHVHAEKADDEGYVLMVDLAEGRPYELTYGLRYDSDRNFEVEAELLRRNFLGMGQTVSLYGRARQDQTLTQLRYYWPTVFGRSWNAFVLAEQQKEKDPDFTRTSVTFQEQTRLAGPFLLLNSYSFRRAHTVLVDPFGERIDFSLNVSRLVSALLADTRDDPVNARRGTFFSSEAEYSPAFLGSDVRFVKGYTQFFRFQPLGRRVLWASGIRFGWASTLDQTRLISSERFFAGGGNTVRGFRFNTLGPVDEYLNEPSGGEAVFILNQEARFPIYGPVGGVFFYDAGNVYNKLGDFSLGDLRHGAGLGLRLRLPYGLLGRADWGINLFPHEGEDRSVWYFSIGQAF